MIKISLYFITILTSFSFLAQKPEDFEKLLDEYKDKDYVVLNDETIVEIKRSKEKGVEIIKKEHIRIYLTSDDAALFKKDKVSSSYFEKLLDIDAFALNKQNNRYKKVKVKDFDSKETISSNVFYDDITVTSFEYEGLKQESIIDLTYEMELTDPHLSISQFFGTTYPLLQKSLTIEVENEVDLEVSYFNMKQEDVDYSKEKNKKTTIYKWSKSKLEINKFEPSSPDIRYFIPHLVTRIKSYENLEGESVGVLRDVDDLHNWYKSFLKDVTCDNEDELNAVLDNLISSGDAEKIKVKKVFEWVQKNVKYIAIEDGLGGFIPRNPDLVMNRRYGDCKDMSTLIVQMLSMLDIKAHKVWIGTDKIPYKYNELPTPLVDNHMIAAYFDKETNKYIFLDATDSKVAFGFPTQFIQGKEALIHQGDSYEIKVVPIIPSSENSFVDSVSLKIQNETLIGSGSLMAKGYYAVDFKHHLNNVKTENSKKSHSNAVTKKGNNKYKLIDYNITTQENLIKYDYSFELSDYIFKNEDEIYINLNLSHSLAFFEPYTKDRKYDVKHRYASVTIYYFTLEIPENYVIDYIPDNVIIEGEDYDVRIKYIKVNDRLLKYSLELDFNFITMKQERVHEIYDMSKPIKSAFNERVVLKKRNQ
jgi:transglutaminase-like putative cysteine protease